MVHNLGMQNSLVSQFVAELRNVNIQNDRLRFRRNLERLGEIFAYEISKHLNWHEAEIPTPLGTARSHILAEQPVVASILRAGLAMHQGLLNYFDRADNAFIAAYRKHDKDGSFHINLEYITSPELKDRILIIADPMLATGSSLTLTLQKIIHLGAPRQIHVVTAIACTVGIDYLMRHLPDVTIWAGAVDEELTAKAYIVPGLGDAGDLAYGDKIQE
ncbi:MAG: uracil phosphoribosyltransferase [Chitinophagales bacterium]|nr:MAG: uracil phosphoribosyltransferase [Chitinophagales bacterium]